MVVEDDLRKEVAALVRAVREKFLDHSAEQINARVEQAVREAREKRE
jgi:hypothetical protein